MTVMMTAAELPEVEETARAILDRRRAEIMDDRLDGRHWFLAVLDEATMVVRQRSAWRRRTSVR